MNLRDFYDQYWQAKDDSVDHDRLELILRWIGPGDTVLQVDGGPGMLAEQLAAKAGAFLTRGSDDRPRHVERTFRAGGAGVVMTETSMVAAERARAKGLFVVRADPDTDALPFADGRFDAVVSDSAIEHRFFPEKSLDESIRVLRPGGKYILLVPNLGHWRCRLWVLFGRFPSIQNGPTDPSHIRFFTLHEARRMLVARGLEVIGRDGSACLWVKGLIPRILRLPPMNLLYARLARYFPSWLARDIILVGRKPLSPIDEPSAPQ